MSRYDTNYWYDVTPYDVIVPYNDGCGIGYLNNYYNRGTNMILIVKLGE